MRAGPRRWSSKDSVGVSRRVGVMCMTASLLHIYSPACRCVGESFCWPCTRRRCSLFAPCIICDWLVKVCLCRFISHLRSTLCEVMQPTQCLWQVCHSVFIFVCLAGGTCLGSICLSSTNGPQESFWSQSRTVATLSSRCILRPGHTPYATHNPQFGHPTLSRQCRLHFFRVQTWRTVANNVHDQKMSDIHVILSSLSAGHIQRCTVLKLLDCTAQCRAFWDSLVHTQGFAKLAFAAVCV